MTARCIAFLGTGSDVGKSIITAGFCRALANRGLYVAPYKAQNMSNNSYVTREGGEMGRAQVVQAEACRLEPCVDMNPVLIKPSGNTRAQVIVHGKVLQDHTPHTYQACSEYCAARAYESLDRLRDTYDVIGMEGAGSCAEVNLAERDFVNCRAAAHADAAAFLIGDIDRGGVFAQLLGTLDLLPDVHRNLVRGLVVNRFRGSREMFSDGVAFLETRSGLPVVGVVPWVYGHGIAEEDAVCLDRANEQVGDGSGVRVGVVHLPHISNFTDFAPLQRSADVVLRYLQHPSEAGDMECIILPGTKNVRVDLDWLRAQDWSSLLRQPSRRILGVCGGYQMLGEAIQDLRGIEGPPGETAALGLLPVTTELMPVKRLTRVHGRSELFEAELRGYEIHMGETTVAEKATPFARLLCDGQDGAGEPDGCVSADSRIVGTYVHGFLDEPGMLESFIRWAGAGRVAPSVADQNIEDDPYDRLADHLEKNLDIDSMLRAAGV